MLPSYERPTIYHARGGAINHFADQPCPLGPDGRCAGNGLIHGGPVRRLRLLPRRAGAHRPGSADELVALLGDLDEELRLGRRRREHRAVYRTADRRPRLVRSGGRALLEIVGCDDYRAAITGALRRRGWLLPG